MSASTNTLRLYAETIRHLRPEQIYGRFWFRAMRPKPNTRPAPEVRHHCGKWIAPARRRQSQTGPDEHVFLNESRSLAAYGWDDPRVSKLWRYNLHYFDDLNAEGAANREAWHRDLIARWIIENPPGQGTAWEPYPTSIRIVNWIKWSLAGNIVWAEAVQSLAVQARWLSRRLEYHLLGNHLFANAKALVFAGCYFEGPEAKQWLAEGMRILAREVNEQILPDGGHFELSPMYHAVILEDLFDLVNVLRTAGLVREWQAQINLWCAKIESMRKWLAVMCHPDGEISFFNDAAMGVAPAPAELETYAIRMGFPRLCKFSPGCVRVEDSGYVRINYGRTVALIDVARIGPDYLPGHAHADTLSFELSVDGQRVLVNSGTSVYGDGSERLRQRGTAAHNTVVIDGLNSSEVWSGFRVGRRARPGGVAIGKRNDGYIVACAHDGYRWLPGRPKHCRSWQCGDGTLLVSDSVEGKYRAAEAVFHIHPDLTPSMAADFRSGILESDSGLVLKWRVLRGSVRLQPSTWHPEFGVTLPSQALLVELDDGQSNVEFSWAHTTLVCKDIPTA